MPPPPPTVAVEVELAGIGGGWTSLFADTLRASGLTIRHGLPGSGPTDLMATIGSAHFALDNSAQNSVGLLGAYSLYHADKRSGWGLGINCRIQITDPTTSTVWTRFRGRLDAIDPTPGVRRDRQAQVTVVDWLDEAARWALTPAIGEQVDQTEDQILAAILAQMPRQPVGTSLDTGTERYAFALDTSTSAQQPALAEFAKLAASEFGPIYLKADGTFTSRNRHARLLTTTSAWTVTDADLQDLALPSTRDEIINTVRVTSHPKIVDALPTTIVYDQANVITIPAGTTKILLGPYRDPVAGDPIGATEIQAPVAGTDYLFVTREDGSGLDITVDLTVTVTSGASGAKFTLTNNNAALGYLTRLQLRGRGIYDRGTVQAEARDAGSVTTYGEHVVHVDMPYQGNGDVAQGAADYLLAKYKDALAQVRSITVVGTTAALLTQLLTRDIDDRITISETVTGAAGDYFINGIELRVRPDGYAEATYTLAPAQDPFAGLYWILGTSTLGTDTQPAPF